MSSLNKVVLIGRLGADPEVRYSSSGSAFANFSIATSKKQKDKNGSWKEKTEWHRIVCLGKTAENAGEFLRKGREVCVEGETQSRKWTDEKRNVERTVYEILAHSVVFLGGKEQSGEGRRPIDDDDDLPF